MKNRDNVYCVVRNYFEIVYTGIGELEERDNHVVGVYENLEDADNAKDAYNQQVKDGKIPEGFNFEVQIATFYK